MDEDSVEVSLVVVVDVAVAVVSSGCSSAIKLGGGNRPYTHGSKPPTQTFCDASK